MPHDPAILKLLDKDLSGFRLTTLTLVYMTDDDGRRTSTVGLFNDPFVANAYVAVQSAPYVYKVAPVIVFTNGVIFCEVSLGLPVKLFDDEAMTLDIKNKVLDKLSPAERRVLGLPDLAPG